MWDVRLGWLLSIPSDGTFSWRFFFKHFLLPYGKSFLIYSKLALLLLKAISFCNTSSLVSLKGWQTLREERKEL